MFREYIRPAILIFIILTALTGMLYPLTVTWISQAAFPNEANGSIIYHDGKAIGSSLIGQPFDHPKYLWGRVSATSPTPYNGASSCGSNLGPSNPALIDTIKVRIEALRSADPDNNLPIPVDLVTSSASGLDAHISRAAAYYQAGRIARGRGIPEDTVKDIIDRNTTGRFLGIIGETTVNVLKVNIDLDSYNK
jgi:potassium-transporting ATPase KdpC subunit